MAKKYVFVTDLDGVLIQNVDVAQEAVIRAAKDEAGRIFETFIGKEAKYSPIEARRALERNGEGKRAIRLFDAAVKKGLFRRSPDEAKRLFMDLATESARKDFERTSQRIRDQIVSGQKKVQPGLTVTKVGRKYLIGTPVSYLTEIVKRAPLTPGLMRFLSELKRNPRIADIYIITATFSPSARYIAKRLGINPKNVFGTRVKTDKDGRIAYIGIARGGKYKINALNKILKKEKLPLNRVIFIGDSITDAEILRHVGKHALSIGFNPTRDAMKAPVLTATTRGFADVSPIVSEFVKKGSVTSLTLNQGLRQWKRARALKSGIEAAHVPPVYVRIPYRSKIAVGGPIYEMVGNNIAYIRTPMPWFGKTTATRWHSRKEIQPTPHLAPMRKRNDVKPKPPGPQEPPWVLTINSARRKMRGKRMARLA